METEALVAQAKNIREDPSLDRATVALIDNLVSALEHADAEARKAWAEVRNQDDRATDERVARLVLESKIQPVLDAWSDPGLNPQYHNNWKNLLRREWWTLYKAVDELYMTVLRNQAEKRLREAFAREYTEERRTQAHLRGGDPT